jgi:RecB family endonuclease NucS
MTTMASAIKEFVQSCKGPVTRNEIERAVNQKYPGQWKDNTFTQHFYACAVNQPKAYIHHRSTEKFLFRNEDGTFEMYSEDAHGPNRWMPGAGDTGGGSPAEIEDLVESSISLERDLESHLISNLSAIEAGLKYVDRQVSTDVGRVDILAEAADGTRVVIEVKVGEAKDAAIGQIARYLGWFAALDKRAARGILIASEFPEGVRFAATAINRLALLSYQVRFSFERVDLSPTPR